MPAPPTARFLEQVQRDLPPDFLSTDPSDLTELGRDWTRVHPPRPTAIALPRSTDEVSRLLALCHAHDVAVVPSGGRTGLAGGAVATRGELVLSLSRMRRMGDVDLLGQTLHVEAGAITYAVHQHAAAHGLTWPVDFASKGSSTVGGNLATNAGGVRVIRHGLTRNWVLGVRAVLADGAVVEGDRALEKNNTGVDLRQLFIGSEGTLGVITEATLKLTRLPARSDVALFALPDLSSVLALFRAVRARCPFPVNAFELFTDRCLARLAAHRKVQPPFARSHSHYVLLEVESGGASTPDALAAFLMEQLESGPAVDVVIAQTPKQGDELWGLREGISESLSAMGLPHKNDIALPIARLEPFCAALEALFAERYPGFEICLFGHVGDGNLHVNVMKPDAMEPARFHEKASELDEAMFTLVAAHKGSISAEHGIGLLKKPYLAYSRTPVELGVMRAIKRALDPRNILNPGKVLDP